jgi:hypothetical protein
MALPTVDTSRTRLAARSPPYSGPMDGSAPRPRVLVIGLDPYRVPGPWDPRPVAEAIEAGMATFADHGLEAQACLVGLDGSEDPEVSIAGALQAGRWDCVVVGGGIRTDPGRLELFESVINLVRRHAPDAVIAFNTSPGGTAEAAARRLAAERPAR